MIIFTSAMRKLKCCIGNENNKEIMLMCNVCEKFYNRYNNDNGNGDNCDHNDNDHTEDNLNDGANTKP